MAPAAPFHLGLTAFRILSRRVGSRLHAPCKGSFEVVHSSVEGKKGERISFSFDKLGQMFL